MKVFITLMASLLTGLSLVVSAKEPASVEDLAWLAGCWANVGGEAGSGEQWTVPAGKTLLGVSRTVRNSRTVAYEFVQIRETEAGGIEYIAKPSGQSEANHARYPMKVFITLMASLLTGLSLVVSAKEPASVEDLAWLAGCWANVGGEAGSGEQWTVPAGKTLLGVSRTVRNSRTVAYEFVQIRETEAGGIEYIAKPSGQSEATFIMVQISESEVVFENLGHDFPQRIIYRLRAGGDLEARIEGEVEGKVRMVDFPMKRVDCESQ